MGTLTKTEDNSRLEMMRMILPDTDLQALYREATKSNESETLNERIHSNTLLMFVQMLEVMLCIVCVFCLSSIFTTYLFKHLATSVFFPFVISYNGTLLWISIKSTRKNGFISTWSRTHATGPFSWLMKFHLSRKYRREEIRALNDDSFNKDPHGMDKIISYLVKEPISQADHLLADIQSQLSETKKALPELSSIIDEFDNQITGKPQDADIDELINSKKFIAERTQAKLVTQSATLLKQIIEVNKAIEPVKLISSRLTSVQAIDQRLNKLQSALNLVNENDYKITSNAIAINTVRATCSDAIDRLQTIDNMVRSFESARAEVLLGV